jgi:hypothetical protein
MLFEDRLSSPMTILFPLVATHNHFVLHRGGAYIFDHSTPIIKLPPDATEDDHLALLGYLNSSTACFWMKQVSHDKAGSGIGRGIQPEDWMNRFEFDSTKLSSIPIPSDRPTELARALDAAASERASASVATVLTASSWMDAPTLRAALQSRRVAQLNLLMKMVALQEELDWLFYKLFGLDEGETLEPDAVTGIRPTNRPMEMWLTSNQIQTDWFKRHGWEPETGFPGDMEPRLQALFSARLQRMTASRHLSLLERPEYKRRWYRPDFPAEEQAALRTWLLDRIESTLSTSTDTQTARQLARALHRDPKVLAVAEVYTGQPEPDLENLFTELVQSDAVPYLAAYRYKPEGLVKYRLWEATWQAQREEDAGKAVQVPLPPKYDSSDFARPEYWSLRGKLDVPKERFVLYPHAGDDDDPTPLLGWAGWDAADRMAALAALVEKQGDPAKRKPLLAGMDELLPWVVQWHGDDDRYGTPMGELWTGHLLGLLTAEGLTAEALRAWVLEKKAQGRKAPKAKAASKPALGREELLQAFEALATNGEGVERSALAERLGVTAAAVTPVAQTLLDEGVWVLLKKRPVVYGSKPA